jgi:hypothetical protein
MPAMSGDLAPFLALLLGFVLMIFGFASIRRPMAALLEHDPIGKFLLRTRGADFTRIAYRIYGVALVLMGFATVFLSLQVLRA